MRTGQPFLRFIAACAAILLSTICNAKTVSICTPDEDFSPLIHVDHEGQAQWLARKAIESQGDTVRFVAVPWRRCLDGVRHAAYDAALPPAFNNEMSRDVAFPMKGNGMDVDRSVGAVIEVVIRRVGSAVNWDGERFTDLHSPVLEMFGIAVVKNKLKALGATVDGGSNQEAQTLNKLLARRGDIAIMQKGAAEAIIARDEFRHKLEILPNPFLAFPVFLAFNKSYYENATPYVEAVWAEIKRLRTSKEWKDVAPLQH